MPRGAAPGERRGGRAKGTPDKATAERQRLLDEALADAFAALGPDYIDTLSPAQFQDRVWREAARAGHIRSAFAMAEKTAAYFDPKKIAANTEPGDEKAITITGGLPPDANG